MKQQLQADSAEIPTAPESDAFPDRVTYQTACRSVCLHTSSVALVALYQALLRAFCRVAAPHGFGSKSAHADLLLAIEVFTTVEEAAPQATCFVHLCLAAGAHAQFPAEQTFALLQVVSDHAPPWDYTAGILLEYEHETFVAPLKKVKTPINRQTFGALSMLTEDGLAAHIMFNMIPSLGSAGRAQTPVQRVLLKRLAFEDVTLNRVRVVGLLAGGGDTKDCAAPAPRAKRRSSRDFLAIFDSLKSTDDPDSSRSRPTPSTSMGQSMGAPAGEGDTERGELAQLLDQLGLSEADVGAGLDDLVSLYASHLDTSVLTGSLALSLGILDKAGDSGDFDTTDHHDDADCPDAAAADVGEKEEVAQREARDSGEAPKSEEPIEEDVNEWAHLGLRKEKHGHLFIRLDGGARAGRVNAVGTGGGTKATCSAHTSCQCWLNRTVEFKTALSDLAEWLSLRGTKAEHQEASIALKQRHGMRTRRT